jgi:hypothetical protein
MLLNAVNLYRFSMISVLMVACLAFFATQASNTDLEKADFVVIDATGSYLMGDRDTVVWAKKKALEQARDMALKKVGVFLSSMNVVKDKKLVSKTEQAIQANIVKEEIITSQSELVLGRPHYIIDARFTIDASAIERYINAIDTLEEKNSEIQKLASQNIKLKELLTNALSELQVANFSTVSASISERQKGITQEASKLFNIHGLKETDAVTDNRVSRNDQEQLTSVGSLEVFDFHFNQAINSYAKSLDIQISDPIQKHTLDALGQVVSDFTWKVIWDLECSKLTNYITRSMNIEVWRFTDAYTKTEQADLSQTCFLMTPKYSSISNKSVQSATIYNDILFNKNRKAYDSVVIEVSLIYPENTQKHYFLAAGYAMAGDFGLNRTGPMHAFRPMSKTDHHTQGYAFINPAPGETSDLKAPWIRARLSEENQNVRVDSTVKILDSEKFNRLIKQTKSVSPTTIWPRIIL